MRKRQPDEYLRAARAVLLGEHPMAWSISARRRLAAGGDASTGPPAEIMSR